MTVFMIGSLKGEAHKIEYQFLGKENKKGLELKKLKQTNKYKDF